MNKDCLFWRAIGVGVVVGLISIGYGLCKNSPLPSPSFSSVAYADDSPSESPKKPKNKIKLFLETEKGGKVELDIDEPLDENTVGELKKILDRTPSSRLDSPTNPPAATATPPAHLEPASKPLTQITIKMDNGQMALYGVEKSTVDEVQRILTRAKAVCEIVMPAPPTPSTQSNDKSVKIIDEMENGQSFTYVVDEKSVIAGPPIKKFREPIPAITPPAETKEPAAKPVKHTSEMNGKASFEWNKERITFEGEFQSYH